MEAARICAAMGFEAQAEQVKPWLWTINGDVYIRDPFPERGESHERRLVDVCIRSELFTPEEIAQGHSYTIGLEWQHSEPLGFPRPLYTEGLDGASWRLLVKAACRAVFEVALRNAVARLEAVRPEVMERAA